MSKLYHVTHTRLVQKIAKEGLRPLQTSNWVRAGGGGRHHGGEVFAFAHRADAVRWAGKMDWEFNRGTGTGKVSVVTLKHGPGWERDVADPLGQAGARGAWLKRQSAVPPHHLERATPITNEHVRAMVAGQTPGLNGPVFVKAHVRKGKVVRGYRRKR